MNYWQIALRVMSYIRYGSFSVNGALRVEDLPVFPSQISTRESKRILPVVCKLLSDNHFRHSLDKLTNFAKYPDHEEWIFSLGKANLGDIYDEFHGCSYSQHYSCNLELVNPTANILYSFTNNSISDRAFPPPVNA